MQGRFCLIEKINREKHVIAKGKTFRLCGYIWHGIELDDHEWTIEFIVDPNYSGILKDAKNRRIKIIDSFESNLAFGTHLINSHDYSHNYEEFIGLNRTSDNAIGSEYDSDDEEVQKRKFKWQQPCIHPVFTFTHSLFKDDDDDEYVYDTTGVIITHIK
jgi:hypothetical protein